MKSLLSLLFGSKSRNIPSKRTAPPKLTPGESENLGASEVFRQIPKINTDGKKFSMEDFISCTERLPSYGEPVIVALKLQNERVDFAFGRRAKAITPDGHEMWELAFMGNGDAPDRGTPGVIVGWHSMPALPRWI